MKEPCADCLTKTVMQTHYVPLCRDCREKRKKNKSQGLSPGPSMGKASLNFLVSALMMGRAGRKLKTEAKK